MSVNRRTTINLAQIFPLTKEQKETFLRDGVLVVENILSPEEVERARCGLNDTLRRHNVDPQDLQHTSKKLRLLSSTNGSGGVLDVFYAAWKMDIATNEKLLSVIAQLWDVGFGTCSETTKDYDDFRRHPHGPFDVNKAYIYIDRIGYRIPTKLSEEVGSQHGEENTQEAHSSSKKRRNWPLQRSLTPHLDCCPQTILENDVTIVSKWRPLQSFVSLTDNLEPNTGGFEAVPGFHRQFNEWARTRHPSVGKKHKDGTPLMITGRDLCKGEYTHIRPVEDKDVLCRVQHVPCRAGSAVIWDNRIPHGNARRNDSEIAREVVYASFLPDVKVNRLYVRNQLKSYLERRIPSDQWIEHKSAGTPVEIAYDDQEYNFTLLGRKLMGMDNW